MRSQTANHQSATGRNTMRRTAVIRCLAALPLGVAAAASAGTAGAARSRTVHISGQASTRDDGRLEATFTSTPVSVTPNLGMVDLIVSGTGSVEGSGPRRRSSEWSRTRRPPPAAPEAPPTARRGASSCRAASSNCTRSQSYA